MKAIEIARFGGPEVLTLCERDKPAPKPGEVLIQVRAAGINRPDLLQRAGHYPVPKGASDLPGLEVAGIIADVGDGATLSHLNLTVGDSICALLQGGGYAEFCTVPIEQCLPVPAGLSMVEAASLPETYFTVWSNVFDRARLGRDAAGRTETFLVQGGTSGIGVAAIQLAKARGHRVFATAGSDEKARACEALGAERGINYRTENFVDVVKGLTDGRGVDVILDMVAGDYVPRELLALADDGRLALIALLGGSKAEADLGQILRRRLTITGSTLRPRDIAFKGAIAENLRQYVWPFLESGAIKPVVFKSFPLAEAADAHRLMESSTHVGKIVLEV
jgi:NADPH2:quinone reductase